MKVLVLGSNGLVGSAFKMASVKNKKIQFIFSNREDCDLLNFTEIDTYLRIVKPDWIINCAGFVGGLKANMELKEKFFKENLKININVIESAIKNNVPNLISFLSTCVFPDDLAKSKALNENDLHNGEPHVSNYPYAYSKRMIDIYSRIARDLGFNYMCLIPTNIFGLNDNYNLDTSHIIPALIHKAYLAKQNDDFLEVWGTGNPLREFIYDKDIVKICCRIIDKNIKFESLIVSSNKSYSIREISEMISDIYGLNGLVFNHNYPDGQFKKETDISLFNKLFPNFKFTPLENGLKETISYFNELYKTDKLKL
jgi:GDP-L-fucose synthase